MPLCAGGDVRLLHLGHEGGGARSWRATGWGRSPSSTPRGWGGLLFGSELKALLCHPGLSREIDLQALDTYLALNYTLAPRTMLREVQQVRPGHRLVYEGGGYGERLLDAAQGRPSARGTRWRRSWRRSGRRCASASWRTSPWGPSSPGARLQRRGGHHAAGEGAPARTFCLAFKEESWGEQDYARRAARYVGRAHQESEVPGEPLADALPRIVAARTSPTGIPRPSRCITSARRRAGASRWPSPGTGGTRSSGGTRRTLRTPCAPCTGGSRRGCARGSWGPWRGPCRRGEEAGHGRDGAALRGRGGPGGGRGALHLAGDLRAGERLGLLAGAARRWRRGTSPGGVPGPLPARGTTSGGRSATCTWTSAPGSPTTSWSRSTAPA